MNIPLQPCANVDAQQHFKDTILSPVQMPVLKRYLPVSTIRYLTEFAGDGAIMVWGLTPGTDHSTITSWSRLGSGDLAAFFASKRVFFVGRICATAQNARLSRLTKKTAGSNARKTGPMGFPCGKGANWVDISHTSTISPSGPVSAARLS